MKKMIVFASVLCLFFAGCASAPTFHTNGSQALKSDSEFGVLMAQPDVFTGRAIKLAGRMIGVEKTAEGTIVMAEWLPYPHVEYQGPSDTIPTPQERFTIFYPGQLDPEGALHGNKFLVLGKMDETRSMASSSKMKGRLPYIKASCLHVWKTGDAEIEAHQPDVENTGYPVMEETYCANT